jgi:arginase
MERSHPGLHVVVVRYEGSARMAEQSDPTPAYAASGIYDAFGPATVVEPVMPDGGDLLEPVAALGALGGEIAEAVAAGRREGRGVLVTGGHCAVLPGVLGGLQVAHGAEARIGLVWFDAHGDFNTPRTSLTGMLGGMPVAVAAGLAWPEWRERSRMVVPIPTDRIVLVDVRNLDPAEEQLIQATDATVAAAAAGRPGADLGAAVDDLARRCDLIYLHIDSDVLDRRYVPNHPTVEPGGPDMTEVQSAVDRVMATGKVAALGLVAVWAHDEGGRTAVESATQLLRSGVESWQRHGVLAR